MYKEFFRKSGNKAYIDTVMMILDQRTKYFNEGPCQLPSQGLCPLRVRRAMIPDYARQCYDLIKGVMETSPQSFDQTYSSLYMAISAKCYALKIIDAPAVITAYSQTMKVVDAQLSRKPDDARYLEARKNIDAVFRSSGAASCSNLEELFTAGCRQKPDGHCHAQEGNHPADRDRLQGL
ncbi:MAG: hypothetical protein MZV63_52180 [Marinilabiliales bacterium]|nr:hypothetical protein [Marinilabiliales bacterium]